MKKRIILKWSELDYCVFFNIKSRLEGIILQDAFFYSLVFDPTAMTLLADKGEIRVGEKYQCDVPDDMAPDAVDENKENG